MAQAPAKYELLKNNSNTAFNTPTSQIRALRDIPSQKVRAGDLGGYVESEHNLSQQGDAWIADQATAIGRSRVEGGALLKDYSIMADYSVIAGSAVVGSFATIKGHAVVRDNARVMGSSSLSDEVLVEGDVNIRHTTHLSGSGEYRVQSQLPWSLHDADPKEPEYLDRVIEAAKIDPAFHRVFAAMGIKDADGRTDAIRELHDDERGRKALNDIVKTVGGKFTPDSYEPRSTADIVTDKATTIQVAMFSPEYTDYRILHSVHGDEGYEQESGDTLYAGIVLANILDPETLKPTLLYQPALYQEGIPDHPTLTPLIGKPMIANEVYTNHIDARDRAADLLKAAITPVEHRTMPDQRSQMRGERLNIELSNLPLLVDSKIVLDSEGKRPLHGYINRLTLQQTGPSQSPLAKELGGLSQPGKFAFLDVPSVALDPFSFTNIHEKTMFHSSPIAAFSDINAVYANPTDFHQRLGSEIAAREERRTYLKSYFDKPHDDTSNPTAAELDNLRAELQSLESPNTPVLVKIISHEEAARTSEPTDLLRWSEGSGDKVGEVAYSDIGGQSVTFRIRPSTAENASNTWMVSVEQRSGVTEQHGYDNPSTAKMEAAKLHTKLETEATARDAALTFDGLKNSMAPMDWNNCRNPNKHAPMNERFLDDAFEATSLHTRFTVEKHSVNDWSLYVDSPDGDVFTQKPFHKAYGFTDMDQAMEAGEAYRISMIMDELSPNAPKLAPKLDADPNTFAAVSRKATADGTRYVPTHVSRDDVGYSVSHMGESYASEGEAADMAIKWLADRNERGHLTAGPDAAPARQATPSMSM